MAYKITPFHLWSYKKIKVSSFHLPAITEKTLGYFSLFSYTGESETGGVSAMDYNLLHTRNYDWYVHVCGMRAETAQLNSQEFAIIYVNIVRTKDMHELHLLCTFARHCQNLLNILKYKVMFDLLSMYM